MASWQGGHSRDLQPSQPGTAPRQKDLGEVWFSPHTAETWLKSLGEIHVFAKSYKQLLQSRTCLGLQV